MRIEEQAITDRETWLAWRKDDVTASVVAALPAFDCHPYVTPLRLFVEKSGVDFPDQDNKVLRRGRWLEPAIAKAVAELRPDWRLVPPELYLRAPEYRLAATPDYYIFGDPRGPGVLQCKSVAPSVYAREWLDGTEIPYWINLQTRTETMLAGVAFGAVAALLVDPFNMDVVILELPRDQRIEAMIVDATIAFWNDVAAGRAPDPDFELDRKSIEALQPREEPGKTLDLSSNNYLRALLIERAGMIERIARMEARCDAIENELRFLAGNAETVTGVDGFKITYKTVNRRAYSVPASSHRTLRIFDKREETDK